MTPPTSDPTPDPLAGPTTGDDDRSPTGAAGHHHGHFLEEHPVLERIVEAAEEAERETGRHEETEAEVRRSLALRAVRTVVGFALIGVGIAGLALPGPGWLIIVVGLSLLPYAWAERTIVLIRQKIPGVPEEGRIPTHTWIIMGLLVVGATVISIVWGGEITGWIGDTWSELTG